MYLARALPLVVHRRYAYTYPLTLKGAQTLDQRSGHPLRRFPLPLLAGPSLAHAHEPVSLLRQLRQHVLDRRYGPCDEARPIECSAHDQAIGHVRLIAVVESASQDDRSHAHESTGDVCMVTAPSFQKIDRILDLNQRHESG